MYQGKKPPFYEVTEQEVVFLCVLVDPSPAAEQVLEGFVGSQTLDVNIRGDLDVPARGNGRQCDNPELVISAPPRIVPVSPPRFRNLIRRERIHLEDGVSRTKLSRHTPSLRAAINEANVGILTQSVKLPVALGLVVNTNLLIEAHQGGGLLLLVGPALAGDQQVLVILHYLYLLLPAVERHVVEVSELLVSQPRLLFCVTPTVDARQRKPIP